MVVQVCIYIYIFAFGYGCKYIKAAHVYIYVCIVYIGQMDKSSRWIEQIEQIDTSYDTSSFKYKNLKNVTKLLGFIRCNGWKPSEIDRQVGRQVEYIRQNRQNRQMQLQIDRYFIEQNRIEKNRKEKKRKDKKRIGKLLFPFSYCLFSHSSLLYRIFSYIT